ncbi:MAG: biotin transporter BioY [Spirochaetaceae bacterium]|nr:MAG: biotin transporter BioY [Spirochaetaceae bacterium]
MFVIFTGLVLPPPWAIMTLLVYLLLGAAGMPVLAGGAGGLAHFAGPTGGFLLAYPAAAWLTSFLVRFGRGPTARAHDASTLRQVTAIVAGFLLVYAAGIPRLAAVAALPLNRALWIGMVPFLPGDILKAVALVVLLRTLPASLWRSWS